MSATLLIAGASARCAVDSAIRAGFKPLAADHFDDEDLRRQCPSYRIHDYPAQLVEITEKLPALPWMYTGGLENYPQIVDQVSRRHQLMGNPGTVLRRAADPFLIQQILADHDLHYPHLRYGWSEENSGRWLRKSRHSTGGKGVTWADPVKDRSKISAAQAETASCYYQQFIPGKCYSAVFLANQEACRLLGATRQIVGKRFTSGSLFAYSGSIGPVDLGTDHQSTLTRIGNALTANLKLNGLFGIDFICQDHVIWTIEINPRFPASVEVLEAALGTSLVGLHCQACRDNTLPRVPRAPKQIQYGKAIVFARQSCTITTECCQHWSRHSAQSRSPSVDASSWFADIPAAGTIVSAGSPLLSVITQGNRTREVQRQLIQNVKRVRQQCNA